VPAGCRVRGLGPVAMGVPALAPAGALVTRVLDLRPAREYPDPDHPAQAGRVDEMGPGGPAGELHLAVQPGLPEATRGRAAATAPRSVAPTLTTAPGRTGSHRVDGTWAETPPAGHPRPFGGSWAQAVRDIR
jgi:hypothetical protein